VAGGTGAVLLQGQAPGDTAAITFNAFGLGSGKLQSGGGDVTLTGDVIDLGLAGTITSTAGGQLVFEPYSTNRPIVLGAGTDQPGALTFTPTDGAAIAQGANSTNPLVNGFAAIHIGGPNDTGKVTSAGALTFAAADVTVESSAQGSAGIDLTDSITVNNHALNLIGGPVVVSGPTTKLQTFGGVLYIQGSGKAGMNNGTAILIDGAYLDSGANGNLFLIGTGAAGQSQAIGVAVVDGAKVETDGTGALTIQGWGGNGTDMNTGVFIDGALTVVGTVNGKVSITGTGEGSGANNDGIMILSGLVQASGIGTLTLNGTSANGTNDNVGIVLASDVAGAPTLVQTLGGQLTLAGFGQGSGSGNDGIDVRAGAVAQAGGTAGVSLHGAAISGTGTHIFSGGHILAGGAPPTVALGLNPASVVLADLSSSDTAAQGYTFIQVDGTAHLNGATLTLLPSLTVIPGMTFNLVQAMNEKSTFFGGQTKTITLVTAAGTAIYDLTYTGTNVTLKRRQ
jgi:hypothetical protein